MWSHISQGLSDTQLEHPSEKTINCCSVVEHLFCYWRHCEIFVSGEYERGHNFCSKALPDGLVLYVCLDSLYVYFE